VYRPVLHGTEEADGSCTIRALDLDPFHGCLVLDYCRSRRGTSAGVAVQ
jgi:hypothetical protein